MRNCFVPLCDSICKNQPRRCMFHPPKNMYEIWKATLPKLKEFKPSDKVCERHFQQSDVIRNFEQVINGEVFKLERGRARLKPNAIPYLNLPSDEDIVPNSRGRKPSKSSVDQPRRSLVKRHMDTTATTVPIPMKNKKIIKDGDIESEQKHNSENESKIKKSNNQHNGNENDDINEKEVLNDEIIENLDGINVDDSIIQQFEVLYDDIFEVILPNTLWGIHRDPDHKLIAITYFDRDYLKTTKSIILNSKGELKVSIFDKLLSEELTTEITPEILSLVINQIDEMRICSSVKKNHNNNNNKCEIEIENDNDILCNKCKIKL